MEGGLLVRRFRRIVRPIAAVWILLGILLTGSPIAQAGIRNDESVLFTIAVKVSPEAPYATSVSIARKDWERAWRTAVAAEEQPLAPSIPYTDVYVEIAEGEGKRTFAMREDGVLVEAGTNRLYALSAKIRKQWLKYAGKLRTRHYGDMLDWEKAKERLPLKSKLTVVDLETGLSFQAQRRAGSHHADVQPLTKADTAVMKQIYGGAWSWKRRAILVLSDGKPIAASMHGMPHGGDGIPDNGFSGHFCIHFLGSTTHRSGQVDPAHQLMVHKAAGELDAAVDGFSPEQLAEALFEALRQQDKALLLAALRGAPLPTQEQFEGLLLTVEGARIAPLKPRTDDPDGLVAQIPVRVTLDGRGGGMREETYRLVFVRETVQSPWILSEAGAGK